MSALIEVLHYYTEQVDRTEGDLARAELDQLHARIEAERDALARQLDEAREFAEYICDNEMSSEPVYQRAKTWLAANPAPQEPQ